MREGGRVRNIEGRWVNEREKWREGKGERVSEGETEREREREREREGGR